MTCRVTLLQIVSARNKAGGETCNSAPSLLGSALQPCKIRLVRNGQSEPQKPPNEPEVEFALCSYTTEGAQSF